MGADNWTKCPQCMVNAMKQIERQQQKLQKSYGKVTPEEFLKLAEKAKHVPGIGETLREDFEIGVQSDGKFFVSYGGSCATCGFEFEFRHEANALEGKEIGR